MAILWLFICCAFVGLLVWFIWFVGMVIWLGLKEFFKLKPYNKPYNKKKGKKSKAP